MTRVEFLELLKKYNINEKLVVFDDTTKEGYCVRKNYFRWEVFSIGIDGIEGLSFDTEKSMFHSFFCDRYEDHPGHSPYDCPNSIIEESKYTPNITLVGIEFYAIIGVKAEIGFDYENFLSDCERIWVE